MVITIHPVIIMAIKLFYGKYKLIIVLPPGPGLAFVAYSEPLARLPGSVFWSILFFFMLGVDTLVNHSFVLY